MNEGSEALKLTAVLDSNVIISGFAFARGNPAEILNLLRQGEIQVYISPFIFEEVTRVLREGFHVDESDIEEVISFLHIHCIVIDPRLEASVSGVSPSDNRVLDCAAQGGVQYLVTGDRAIQQLKDLQGVKIISPVDFLQVLRSTR